MKIIQEVDKNVWQAVSPLIVNKKDGSILVWIPPGEFEMGDEGYRSNPKHRVFLDGYYMGVHCITNRQYRRFVEATTRDRHRNNLLCHVPDNSFWQDRSKADHPVVDVNWEDASAYCAWAGLALPTEAQWERAARGPGNLIYPWGNAWNENKCRHKNNRGSETTCPVFAYPQGVSGFGTLNQSGNVDEWCRDWYNYGKDNIYFCDEHGRGITNPDASYYQPDHNKRVMRGGGWDLTNSEGSFMACHRRAESDYCEPFHGFRPCLEPFRPYVVGR